MNWLILIGLLLSAYLIGSIPTGYIIVKALKGVDIREVGSGSTGATNVKRVLGTKFFILVMLLDGFKGLLPILAIKLSAVSTAVSLDLLTVLTAIALVIGHSKSAFLGFKGGKSVAISVGVLYGLAWPVALMVTLVWILLVILTKYVSVGSIIATSLSPLFMWMFEYSNVYISFAFICALYVFYLHRENVKRLLQGNENKISFKEK